jgi:3-dehydroquinate synthase
MDIVKVNTQQLTYDILIGDGVLEFGLEKLSDLLGKNKICCVTDENVAPLYLEGFLTALKKAGVETVAPIIIPAGEKSKNFEILQSVISKSLGIGLNRKTALVALGGGVVGDITGFAASVIMRGIPFIQIPTTLLAQVDSSVGGKTGINTAQGKNLVGSFYQPSLVLIDTQTLKTLPVREMKAGYAEILKYALINDPSFFDWLEDKGSGVLEGVVDLQKLAIRKSCQSKADIVAADEREEKDIRALLNLGHTFGHALEVIGGYDGRLLHGEAVAIGCKLAFDFSVDMGICPKEDALRLTSHLEKAGMMMRAPFDVDVDDMVKRMQGDKKNTEDGMTLILARGIGRAFVQKSVDVALVRTFLQKWIG